MSTRRSWRGSSQRAIRAAGVGAWLLTGGWLAGCTSSEVVIAHNVDLVSAADTVPEDTLLDVGITVFNPGVPEGDIDKELLEELIREGTFVQIRRSEALYMAVALRDTLQQSGHWGGVWVTPEESLAADVNVNAEILHSDGDYFALQVKAVDATGRVWLDDEYEMNTAAGAFNRQRYPELDPYQDVFNRISNDLAAAMNGLSAAERGDVRTVASLRYAAELSPDAFEGYVVEERRGYVLNRLPADGDPMFDRTQRVRQRERLFFETLDQHYEKFHIEAMPSYDSWRQYAREEAIALRELTQSTRWRTGIGIATILTSIVYGSNSNNNSFSDRVIRDALMYVGMDMLRTSAVRRQEKRLHTEALEELSASFDDDVEPLVVEIQGTQRRLTGTAEAQYQEWRDLLRELFVAETGFVPEDLEIYTEPQPAAAPAESTGDPAAESAESAEPGVEAAPAPAPPLETQAVPEEPAEESDAGSAEAVTDAGNAPPSGA